MIHKRLTQFAIVLFTLTVSSCGGGGGGSGGDPQKVASAPVAPTVITGSISAPVAPGAAPPVGSVDPTPPTDMLLPPAAHIAYFPAVAQSMSYGLILDGAGDLKVTSIVFASPLDLSNFLQPFIDVTSLPGDPSLGKPYGMNVVNVLGLGSGSTFSIDSLGGLPALLLDGGNQLAGYVMPYSTTLNPSGFTYQTFGSWLAVPPSGILSEGYFSAGVPIDNLTVPSGGSAMYTGQLGASMVDAALREPYDVIATFTLSVNHSTRTIVFSTSGTTALSQNLPETTPYTPRPDLDISGVLTYVSASNTFTGPVTTASGMAGTATGRLYGAGLSAATASKSIGSAPEVGGTFAVKLDGLGVMQGAFGGK